MLDVDGAAHLKNKLLIELEATISLRECPLNAGGSEATLLVAVVLAGTPKADFDVMSPSCAFVEGWKD